MSKMKQSPKIISICGVMAQVLPEKMEEVTPLLLAIQGLEIHAIGDDGKLVITVESEHYKETGRRITTLQNIKGILSASMIYQHTETVGDEAMA
ncbi:MAG: chaperone NapD [Cocleimonas sp.]|nr:chaperone NapD [Cocleimonas sp.]